MSQPCDFLEEAVRRMVDEAQPLQIIVFGSAVRADARPQSDLDLLVVVPDDADRLDVAYRLHRCLRGLGCPKDIVVVLESEVAALRDNPSLVIHTALAEGREVYHAA